MILAARRFCHLGHTLWMSANWQRSQSYLVPEMLSMDLGQSEAKRRLMTSLRRQDGFTAKIPNGLHVLGSTANSLAFNPLVY